MKLKCRLVCGVLSLENTFLKVGYIGNDKRDLPLGLSNFTLYSLEYSCQCFDRPILPRSQRRNFVGFFLFNN